MCCGSKRAAATAIKREPPVVLEYRGDATLTVVGASTRRVYWFSGRGAKVAVHASDAGHLTDRSDLARIAAP